MLKDRQMQTLSLIKEIIKTNKQLKYSRNTSSNSNSHTNNNHKVINKLLRKVKEEVK